jgi:hypothetical protein
VTIAADTARTPITKVIGGGDYAAQRRRCQGTTNADIPRSQNPDDTFASATRTARGRCLNVGRAAVARFVTSCCGARSYGPRESPENGMVQLMVTLASGGREPPDDATQRHAQGSGGSRPPLAGTICYLAANEFEPCPEN